MAFVIDRVDVLAYVAAEPRVLDDASGTLSVPLARAAAYYLRETVPGGREEPLTHAFWEPGHDLVIQDGADLRPQLAEGAQIYATGRLLRRILETEGETLCRNEVVCGADDVVVLRGGDGRRDAGIACGDSSGPLCHPRCRTHAPWLDPAFPAPLPSASIAVGNAPGASRFRSGTVSRTLACRASSSRTLSGDPGLPDHPAAAAAAESGSSPTAWS